MPGSSGRVRALLFSRECFACAGHRFRPWLQLQRARLSWFQQYFLGVCCLAPRALQRLGAPRGTRGATDGAGLEQNWQRRPKLWAECVIATDSYRWLWRNEMAEA